MVRDGGEERETSCPVTTSSWISRFCGKSLVTSTSGHACDIAVKTNRMSSVKTAEASLRVRTVLKDELASRRSFRQRIWAVKISLGLYGRPPSDVWMKRLHGLSARSFLESLSRDRARPVDEEEDDR